MRTVRFEKSKLPKGIFQLFVVFRGLGEPQIEEKIAVLFRVEKIQSRVSPNVAPLLEIEFDNVFRVFNRKGAERETD